MGPFKVHKGLSMAPWEYKMIECSVDLPSWSSNGLESGARHFSIGGLQGMLDDLLSQLSIQLEV